jgi:branched-chain amino acid transport system permease protein
VSVLKAVSLRRKGEASPADISVEVEREEAPSTAAAPFRPSPVGWAFRGMVMAGLAALVFLVPLTRPQFEVNIYAQAVTYAIIGLSLNVLIGYAGQISLGHQAFVGIGSFMSAYMVTVHRQNFILAVAVAMGVGALQAFVLGLVSLRVTGLYFALVTLAYGLVAEESIFQVQRITGGSAGQPAPKPTAFATDYRYYYLCLAFLAAVLWVDWRLMKTKGGRALLALRENPRVAATFGTDVKLYTLASFVIAGTFAGLGGALLAHNTGVVVSVLFDFRLALIFIIMTVVGGLRSRPGVVIGSAFFALIGFFFEKCIGFGFLGTSSCFHIADVLNKIPGLPNLTGEIAPLVLGPLLLLFTLTTNPGGIGQQIRPVQRWLGGRKLDLHEHGEGEVRVTDVRA